MKVKKTEFAELPNCSIHNTPHTLNDCRSFRWKPLRERKQILRDINLCYKCCESKVHVYNTCDANLNCSECGSERQGTGMDTVPRNNQHLQDLSMEFKQEPLLGLTVGSSHPDTLLDLTAGKQI